MPDGIPFDYDSWTTYAPDPPAECEACDGDGCDDCDWTGAKVKPEREYE